MTWDQALFSFRLINSLMKFWRERPIENSVWYKSYLKRRLPPTFFDWLRLPKHPIRITFLHRYSRALACVLWLFSLYRGKMPSKAINVLCVQTLPVDYFFFGAQGVASWGWESKLLKIFSRVSSAQLRYSNWSNFSSMPLLLKKTFLTLSYITFSYVNLISISRSCFDRPLLSPSKIVNIRQVFSLW